MYARAPAFLLNTGLKLKFKSGLNASGYVYAGELSVFCVGPQSLARCTLTDHQNGRVTLTLSPVEHGTHLLHVKFGATHVPGSV